MWSGFSLSNSQVSTAALENECKALVKVLTSYSYVDDESAGSLYTVQESEILEVINCPGKFKGDTIHYLQPGGKRGNLIQSVAGIHLQQEQKEYIVHLSSSDNKASAALLLNSSSPTSELEQAGYAFECWRAGGQDSGPSLFWRDRNIVMHPAKTFAPEIPPEMLRDAMQFAADQWNGPDCSDLKFIIGEPIDTNEIQKFDLSNYAPQQAQNVVIVRKETEGIVGSAWSNAKNFIAVTYSNYWSPSGEIFEADVIFNADYFDLKDCEKEKCTVTPTRDMDFYQVMVHEFGHVLGLSHPDPSNPRASDTTMYSTSMVGQTSKRTLAEDDIAAMCFVYPTGEAEAQNCFEDVRIHRPTEGSINTTPSCSQTKSGPSIFPVWLMLLFLLFGIRNVIKLKEIRKLI